MDSIPRRRRSASYGLAGANHDNRNLIFGPGGWVMRLRDVRAVWHRLFIRC